MMIELRVGALLSDQRQGALAEPQHRLLIRVVVHPADETDQVRIVGLGGRREVFVVNTVRKPIGRNAGAEAFECREFFPRRAGIQIEQRREPLFFGFEFRAFEL